MEGFFRTFRSSEELLQRPFDVAVVMPSILRPSLVDALFSVFRQEKPERIQVLIGIDQPGDTASPDIALIERACKEMPPHIVVQVLYPGYSTSVRHGGLALACDGGSLRTILTHLANAPYIAYLDDDNTWTPDHLLHLLHAIAHVDYAWSLRWFVHHTTGRPVAIDEWESVGPGMGIFAARFGGFIDPSCLMIRRERCKEALVAWTAPVPGDPSGMSADRMVFSRLLHLWGASVCKATTLYRVNPADGLHEFRLQMMRGAYEAPERDRG